MSDHVLILILKTLAEFEDQARITMAPNTPNDNDDNNYHSATDDHHPNKHQSAIQISTERIIDAPIDVVWEIMVDVKKYSDWNPFITSVSVDWDNDDGDPANCETSVVKVGTVMTLNVVFPNQHNEQSQQLPSSNETTDNKKRRRPKSIQSKEEVVLLDPPDVNHADGSSVTTKSATWSYRFVSWLDYFNLVRATRIQRLTEIIKVSPSKEEGGGKEQQRQRTTYHTRYYTEEQFSGLLARFVPLKQVQLGFEVQADH